MITAFVYQKGIGQVVLTPENDEEKRLFALVSRKPEEARISQGSYYLNKCQGGWVRQFKDDDSLIITLGVKDGKEPST